MTDTLTELPNLGDFEGSDPKVLFVCSAGRLRSATAARIFANVFNTRCAGSSSEFALVPVTEHLLNWADVVIFMMPENMMEVSRRFDLDDFKCLTFVWNIPDKFNHMHPELIERLKENVNKLPFVLDKSNKI